MKISFWPVCSHAHSTISRIALLLIAITLGIPANSQVRDITDSGGVLSSEQAAYDVRYHALQLEINPDQQSIEGALSMVADVVQPMYYLVMDLDTFLQITTISENRSDGTSHELMFTRNVGQVWINLERTRQPGESLDVRVDYGGKPRVARRPPWSGGFTWDKTPSGAHWIATTCQGEGADLWWPCKDHVSDEPDSMDLYITVPKPLVAACNGALRSTEESNDKTTYHWHISQPINIYNVALNIAPYELIEDEFVSVSGESFPFQFFVLPEYLEQGREAFPEFMDHLKFYEKLLGPYPFRADKYGVAHTPHLGMEHQSIIAYGANFNNKAMTGFDWGYDALHHHELAHEWWGNMVTNSSWEDMWIHEGFGSYMQALYCEDTGGQELYFNYMRRTRRFPNTMAVAPASTKTSGEIYRAPIYSKGAWVLHTLRYVVGDDAFFKSLHTMCYPDASYVSASDGSQCRFVNTDDFIRIVEDASGMELDWFFEVYVRQPRLPVLNVQKDGKDMLLSWESPVYKAFPMPVVVRMNGVDELVEVPEDGYRIEAGADQKIIVDPMGWILCEINK